VFLLLGLLSSLFIPVPSHTFLWQAVNNFAHVPLFGIVAILLLNVFRMLFTVWSWPPIRYYVVTIMGALVLALLTEALQSFGTTRHPEVSDVVRDLVGAMCGVGLFSTYDSQMSGKWTHWRKFSLRSIIRLCVVLVIGITLLPVVGWTYAYWDRASRFPTLLEFSSDWEMKFVKASNSELQVVVPPVGWKKLPEDKVGQVVFHTKMYPGIRIDEPYPDWRGYSHFKLEIFSELPNSQSIVIRIDDLHHNNEHSDRFNRAFTISLGLNHIQIPIDDIRLAPVGREIDLRAMKAVLLFAVNPREEFTLYLDNILLE
jgi:glycopeptide antibiotics resistance protein